MNDKIAVVVSENENLVFYIMKKYLSYADYNDLYQAGVLGLIEAYHHYDIKYETKFSTFAYSYIDGRIKRYLRESQLIKMTPEISHLKMQLEKARNLLLQKMMREPTVAELANFLEIDEKKIMMISEGPNRVISLDSFISNNGENNLSWQEIIASEEKIDKDDLILLRDNLNKLSQEDREIIQLRYFEDKTQREIAESLGITQVQVSRNEAKVLKKIRSFMH